MLLNCTLKKGQDDHFHDIYIKYTLPQIKTLLSRSAGWKCENNCKCGTGLIFQETLINRQCPPSLWKQVVSEDVDGSLASSWRWSMWQVLSPKSMVLPEPVGWSHPLGHRATSPTSLFWTPFEFEQVCSMEHKVWVREVIPFYTSSYFYHLSMPGRKIPFIPDWLKGHCP